MKNLETDVQQLLQDLEVIEFQSIEFSVSGQDFYFTNCEMPLKVDDTNLYDSRAFSQISAKYSSRSVVDSTSLKIDNADDYLTPFFIADEPEGNQMIVRRFWMSGDPTSGYFTMVTDPIIIFDGNIDSWTSSDGEISIKLKSEFNQWNQITLRIQSSSCPWKVFKGTECQYAGSETWCDRTYTRCVALANTANFGGERWVASIIDKVIWWGRAGG
jgi:hypothetical protein